MKAQDLKERSSEDLAELKGQLQKDLFSYRMKNHTGQLADTSLINKTRRDIARIEQVLHVKTLQVASGASADKAVSGKGVK